MKSNLPLTEGEISKIKKHKNLSDTFYGSSQETWIKAIENNF